MVFQSQDTMGGLGKALESIGDTYYTQQAGQNQRKREMNSQQALVQALSQAGNPQEYATILEEIYSQGDSSQYDPKTLQTGMDKVLSNFAREKNIWDDLRASTGAKQYDASEKYVTESKHVIDKLQLARGWVKELSGLMGMAYKIPGTKAAGLAAKLRQLGPEFIKPALDKIAERGPVQAFKVKLLLETHGIDPWSSSAVNYAKIDNLINTISRTREFEQKRLDLLEKYKGVIPRSEMQKLERLESEMLDDAIKAQGYDPETGDKLTEKQKGKKKRSKPEETSGRQKDEITMYNEETGQTAYVKVKKWNANKTAYNKDGWKRSND